MKTCPHCRQPLLSALYQARLKAGMTQAELAVHVGFGQATISKLEKRQRAPTLAQARKLAGVLRKPVHLLFPEEP